jgi:hypothetical protein
MTQPKIQRNTVFGYRPKAFTSHIRAESEAFRALNEAHQMGMAAILWSMHAGRFTHNSGVEDVSAIHWRGKASMFGSAKQFTETNALLEWFVLDIKPRRGHSAGGWRMTERAKEICMGYQENSKQYALSGLEPDEKGLVNPDGSPYRMPADGIRSRTSSGNHTRFPKKQIHAAVEIEGDNLHKFHHAAQAYLDGEKPAAAFRWSHDEWNAIRTGRGPNSGEDAAIHRATEAKQQASIMLDLAKRSGAPGFVLPTTYRESNAGRLYAEGQYNLQRCLSEVRRAALKGCYDVDIANCHWSLLAQMADRLGEKAPHILHYLDNKKATRAEIASAGGISTVDAKFLLLAVVYGATLARSQKENQRAIEQRLGMEATDRLRELPLVLDLYGDVRRIGRAVLLDYQARSKKPGALVNDAGREIGLKSNSREKLAHILQGAESMALQSMLKTLAGSVALLQHDGLTVHGKPEVAKLERRIKADTGYGLTLEIEQL